MRPTRLGTFLLLLAAIELAGAQIPELGAHLVLSSAMPIAGQQIEVTLVRPTGGCVVGDFQNDFIHSGSDLSIRHSFHVPIPVLAGRCQESQAIGGLPPGSYTITWYDVYLVEPAPHVFAVALAQFEVVSPTVPIVRSAPLFLALLLAIGGAIALRSRASVNLNVFVLLVSVLPLVLCAPSYANDDEFSQTEKQNSASPPVHGGLGRPARQFTSGSIGPKSPDCSD